MQMREKKRVWKLAGGLPIIPAANPRLQRPRLQDLHTVAARFAVQPAPFLRRIGSVLAGSRSLMMLINVMMFG